MSPSSAESPPTTAASRRGFIRRHWLATTVGILVVVPALVFTIWAGVALSYTYSQGTRTGFVQKLSRKGWVCKTWEGELAMVNMPGAMTGIDLGHLVRQRWPKIQILLSSGYLKENQDTNGFALLQKPYRAADLIEILRGLIGETDKVMSSDR